MIKTAMIMAAGHGTRMRPLTNNRSKAMVEVGGMPLIGHMLTRLQEIGVERAVVNVHAHADHLEDYLQSRTALPATIISDERAELLETGGGVVKALPLLGDEPVLICNIDAIWLPFEPALEALLSSWDPAKMDELLLLARGEWSLGYHGKGDFDLQADGRIIRRQGETAEHVYAGVQIFKPALARPFTAEPFSRNKIWDETMTRRKLYGMQLNGFWMHVGDPGARDAAEAVLKQG